MIIINYELDENGDEIVIKYCKKCEESKIKHTFQDTKYGNYVRVMNPTKTVKANNEIACRCTVCGQVESTTK